MADKSLGQHWLFDKAILRSIAERANRDDIERIIEIGPGLGTLTHELLALGKPMTAIELDRRLLDDLEEKFRSREITFVHQDILKFDFSLIKEPYSVAANIPYYLTSHLLRILTESENRPKRAVLLMQKEVAQRVVASDNDQSILSLSVALYADASVHEIVPPELFSPPPKVDSQVLCIDYLAAPRTENPKAVMRVVRAGFSSPRKKLRSSLSAGLGIAVGEAEMLLRAANVDPNRRASTLSLDEWITLTNQVSAQ